MRYIAAILLFALSARADTWVVDGRLPDPGVTSRTFAVLSPTGGVVAAFTPAGASIGVPTDFAIRPTVDGTPVLIEGDATSASNLADQVTTVDRAGRISVSPHYAMTDFLLGMNIARLDAAALDMADGWAYFADSVVGIDTARVAHALYATNGYWKNWTMSGGLYETNTGPMGAVVQEEAGSDCGGVLVPNITKADYLTSDTFTYQIWARMYGWGTPGNGDVMWLWWSRNNAIEFLFENINFKLKFVVRDASSQTTCEMATDIRSSWYSSGWNHYVYTQCPTSGVLYLNGTNVAEITSTKTPDDYSGNTTSGGTINWHPSSCETWWWEGTMDEVAWWTNRYMTQDEVLQLFNSGVGRALTPGDGLGQGLAIYHKFDTGDTADSTENGWDAVLDHSGTAWAHWTDVQGLEPAVVTVGDPVVSVTNASIPSVVLPSSFEPAQARAYAYVRGATNAVSISNIAFAVSRNAGTNWSSFAATDYGYVSGTSSLFSGTGNLTNGSGTNMVLRLDISSNESVNVLGFGGDWK